jgi:phosphomannomutase / phosphoglucomutase
MTGIFKAYDIRGVVGEELTEDVAMQIGKAFGTLKCGKVYVGGDCRETTPELKKAFIAGLVSTGCRVIDVGVASTPLINFCSGNYNACGVIITASHSAKKFNGVKFYDEKGVPVSYESGIGEIGRLVSTGEFKQGDGSVEVFNPREDYTTHLIGSLGMTCAKLKVVVDCMNGAGSLINPFVLEKLGVTVLKIRCNEDGNFPDSGPNPSDENLTELKQKVIETGADIGFGFDGDADRLTAVDEQGRVIEPKNVFSLLVKNSAHENNLKVVHDALTSRSVDDVITGVGGEPLVCRVGHTYVSQMALENGAQLSGELSGHYFFKETFYNDDALFASMKIIQYLVKQGKTVSETLEGLPIYFSSGMRIGVNGDAKQIVNKLINEFAEKYGDVDTLDGVKVNFENGWMLFRASNTGPKISIAYESKNKDEFEKIDGIVKQIVERIEL